MPAPFRIEDLRAHASGSFSEVTAVVPGHPVRDRRWFYPESQYAVGTLHRLVAEGFAVNRHVHYAANYAAVATQAEFRHAVDGRVESLVILPTGNAALFADGQPIGVALAGTIATILVPGGSGEIVVRVDATDGAIALRADCLLDHGDGSCWEARLAGKPWRAADDRLGSAESAPHLVGEPLHSVRPRLTEPGRYELDAPVLGRVLISSLQRPTLTTGESLAESLATDSDLESRHDLIETAPGKWASVHQLGFRYLRVEGSGISDVMVEASLRPTERRGAFVSSDPALNRVWDISAYTLHQCMQGLMLDGIKRDRMPWIGDQAINTLSNAYAFADATVVRDSLVALGSPTHGYINGISDYSLWWLINFHFYHEHFGDNEFVAGQASSILTFVSALIVHTDDAGLFQPPTQEDGFTDTGEGSVFIDWGVTVTSSSALTGLQILWYWALRSAASLLSVGGRPESERLESLADGVESILVREGLDPVTGRWREHFGDAPSDAVYPDVLAVLSGLAHHGDPEAVRSFLADAPPRGTPFMRGFALRALATLGGSDRAVAHIREEWGAMVDAGASSFWEEFSSVGRSDYEMYGRPFGKSMCHAWGGAPAGLLPEIVLGIRPLQPGWAAVAIQPQLGDLEWAAAIVPSAHGDICVIADAQSVRLDVPAGVSVLLESGLTIVGPAVGEYPRTEMD